MAYMSNPNFLDILHLMNCKLLDPLDIDPSKNSTPPCESPTVGANCRGFVTADVLEKGLSRGAIAMG